MPLKFTHVHSSGRFDRPLSLSRADLKVFHRIADVCTYTEQSGNNAERRKMYRADATWDFFYGPNQPGQDETVIEWARDAFASRGPGKSTKLTNKTWTRSKEYGGHVAPYVHANHVVLDSVATPGFVLIPIAVHMPLDNTQQRAEVWLDCTHGLRELVRSLRASHRYAKILIAADWNKNYGQADERAKMQRNVATPLKMRQAWAGNLPPKGGTHGPRALIDGDITDLMVRDCDLLKDTPSSDHRPYRSILQFQSADKRPAPKK